MNRISLLLLAGAATLVSASAASAADLLVNQPAPSYGDFVGTSAGGWDGAYVGGFVGFGWGTAADGVAPVFSEDVDLSGWTVGAKLGANFTVAPGFILGAEGDVAWSGIGGSDAIAGSALSG